MSATAEHRPTTRRRRFRHDYLVADLFSGFGGLTQGIERAGAGHDLSARHLQQRSEREQRTLGQAN